MEDTDKLIRRLDLAEARIVGLTIAVGHLLQMAGPQSRKELHQALTKTAEYALSKALTDAQIEGLLALAHQIGLPSEDHDGDVKNPD